MSIQDLFLIFFEIYLLLEWIFKSSLIKLTETFGISWGLQTSGMDIQEFLIKITEIFGIS